MERPIGLWPFTHLVLEQIEQRGGKVLKIEAHDEGDQEGADFIWGLLTPELQLSEGDYLKISSDFGLFYSEFGQRGCCGGDATWGERFHLAATDENAVLVAGDYLQQFSSTIREESCDGQS